MVVPLLIGVLSGPVLQGTQVRDPAADTAEPQTVTLRNQTASVAVLPGTALKVTFELEVVNDLPLDIRGIDVGVIFGASPEALEHADPDVLYQKGEGRAEALGGPVMVVREQRGLRVEGKGAKAFSFSRSLEGSKAEAPPAPAQFVTHVLGYDLADPTADLLLKLLDTQVPADEVAAVRAFALLGSAAEKTAARTYWKGSPQVIEQLAVVVDGAPPSPATHQQLMRWTYVVGALAIAGRTDILERLSKQSLESLDEAFQVLRLARLGSSALQAPLAFALPPDASTFGLWVKSALATSRSEFRPANSPLPEQPTQTTTDLPQPTPATPEKNWPMVVGALLAAVAILGAYVGLRSTPSAQDETEKKDPS